MGENEAGAVLYSVAARQSRFIVRAFSTGLLSVFAHNPTIAIRDFTGEVRCDPHSPENASVEIRINANSFEVIDEISDKDRREIERQMREEVLETARFPEIIFESTNVKAQKSTEGQYRARAGGKLFVHGVTRDIEIQTQAIIGPDSLRAHGEFSLRMSYFNIKQVSAVGGTIKLKDDLKLSYDIVARKE